MVAVFGWFSSSNNDSNFLKVANTFTNRRLSDNTLMAPKIRVAPSCASSPGDTRGGGLPIRRHSSTGPQERRGSSINLSPPTVLYLHYFPSFPSFPSLILVFSCIYVTARRVVRRVLEKVWKEKNYTIVLAFDRVQECRSRAVACHTWLARV